MAELLHLPRKEGDLRPRIILRPCAGRSHSTSGFKSGRSGPVWKVWKIAGKFHGGRGLSVRIRMEEERLRNRRWEVTSGNKQSSRVSRPGSGRKTAQASRKCCKGHITKGLECSARELVLVSTSMGRVWSGEWFNSQWNGASGTMTKHCKPPGDRGGGTRAYWRGPRAGGNKYGETTGREATFRREGT